ncbi:type II toxin-antitoxin system HipA family toxin YjjJ [Fluviibacter phosphoraccumulans]|uniref:type II toxin-antitoxin system HipA family toxin YjjJ n=1 Tax=Fluviibacter phosphoraccumulans TaxID=1751046 RepID=UPI001B3C503A|nr:type II toxin-antitoxin system HipA family toxin YjjJ [Fluviibacter phosphoraccumulans]
MSIHLEKLRDQLANGPMRARQLVEKLQLSQPTLSRAIAALGDEVVRLGAGPSIHYALRDRARGIGEAPVYRVSAEGILRELGTLIPVRPDGYVMVQSDGKTLHSESLPWWLYDMRPQGYLGRAYASRHAQMLGLPAALNEWNDTHALRALLAHGHDAIGNLLLGNAARDAFLANTGQIAITEDQKQAAYTRRALDAARGDYPGSSAGGEQPKFLAYSETPSGPRHVIVKFTAAEDHAVSQRWRDLLLAEHLALHTLHAANISAAQSRIVDAGTQRFLEVERFDRFGEFGRRAVFSLAALDAEFVGMGNAGWAPVAQALVQQGCVEASAGETAALLQAFGVLIGNTDMHAGNLSFVSEYGRPYQLAPAYDMLPMGFAPRSGGEIPASLSPARIHAYISHRVWHSAEQIARGYVTALREETGFSPAFQPCIEALATHIEAAAGVIARLES